MKNVGTTIRRVHQRAKELQKKRDKRLLQMSGVISSLLCIALLAAAVQIDLHAVVSPNSSFAGSSLLSESVGGYVLVGVVAFMAGVVLTVIIKKYVVSKERGTGKRPENTKDPCLPPESDTHHS